MNENRAARRVEASLIRKGAEADSETVAAILTVKEAAAYCRLGKPTLDRLRVTGDGARYAKIGGAVRYRKADLDAWLESKLISSTSQTV
jgi:excisionase family DNA binding protein